MVAWRTRSVLAPSDLRPHSLRPASLPWRTRPVRLRPPGVLAPSGLLGDRERSTWRGALASFLRTLSFNICFLGILREPREKQLHSKYNHHLFRFNSK